MRNANIILAVNDAVRCIACTYEPNDRREQEKDYTFKTLDQSIAVGDYVIVPTGTRHGMTVVKVKEVDVDFDIESSIDLAWIIDKVETVDYEAVLEKEREIIKMVTGAERRRKREAIRETLLAGEAEGIMSAAAALAPPKQDAPDPSIGESDESFGTSDN